MAAAATEVASVTLAASGVPSCVAQLLGPAGVLAGAVAGADGRAVVTAELPAASIPWVRAEVRRPAAPVTDPVGDVSAAPMVALTNPVFVSASAA